jgi:hypothetical protein
MSTKKRKPLGNAMEEFVFGTQEAASSTPPDVVSPAATPTASLTPETASPTIPPQPEVSAPDPVPIQSKEPSLMSKLQAPDKEATVRFTVDMSETLHRKLSMLAAKTERKKVDQSVNVTGGWVEGRGLGVRILLILCDHCTRRVAIAFSCYRDLNKFLAQTNRKLMHS